MTRWFLAIVLLTACGGDDAACPTLADAAVLADAAPADPLCATGSQCGGDLVGTWTVTASCAQGTGDASLLNCAAGTLIYHDFLVRGTWTIAGDGTVTAELDERIHGDAVLPLDCYGFAGCDQVAVLFAAGGAEASCLDDGPLDDSCEVVPQTCRCQIGIEDPQVSLEGNVTWDPVGTITFTLGSETISGEYCVTGDQLWIHATRFGGVDYHYVMERAL